MNNPAISLKILGFDCALAPGERYLVTNISAIFSALLQERNTSVDHRGFYPSAPLVLEDGRHFRVIHVPPGNVVIDVLKVIAPHAGSIGLLGLCGSLNENHPIGSLVTPAFVTEKGSPDNRLPLNPLRKSGTCICQVDGLVQEETLYRHLAGAGIDFVDMESWFLRTFVPGNIPVYTCSFVSDMPLFSPFYVNEPFLLDIDKLLDIL